MIDRPKLEEEFGRLLADLQQIEMIDSSVKGRRLQTAQSLNAINVFLRTMDVDRNLRAPIMRLINALSDADSGISNDLLRPDTMDLSASRIPETEVQHKAALSVAVTLLKSDARWKLEEAAKLAAKAIDMDHRALITFRKNVCSRRGSEAALKYYFDLLDLARKQSGSPEERARVIIDGVRSEWVEIVQ